MLSTYLPHHPEIGAYLWFNWNFKKGEKRADWPIESSAPAQQQFRKAIQSSLFVPGPVSLPSADQSAAAARRSGDRGAGRRPLAGGGDGGRPRRRRSRRTAPPPSSGALAAAASSPSSRGRSPPTGRRGPIRQLSAAGQDALAPQVAVAPDGTAIVAWSRWDGANFRLQERRIAPDGTPEEATQDALGHGPGRDSAAGRRRPRRHRRPSSGSGSTASTTSSRCARSPPDGTADRRLAATLRSRPGRGRTGRRGRRRRHRHRRLEPLRRLRLDRPGAADRARRDPRPRPPASRPPGESAHPAAGRARPRAAQATVVWNRFDGSNWVIQGQRFAADGTAAGAVFDLSAAGRSAAEPQLAIDSRRRGNRRSGTATTAANFVVQARRSTRPGTCRRRRVQPLRRRPRCGRSAGRRRSRRQRDRRSGAASTAPTGSSSGATLPPTGVLAATRPPLRRGSRRRRARGCLGRATGPWRWSGGAFGRRPATSCRRTASRRRHRRRLLRPHRRRNRRPNRRPARTLPTRRPPPRLCRTTPSTIGNVKLNRKLRHRKADRRWSPARVSLRSTAPSRSSARPTPPARSRSWSCRSRRRNGPPPQRQRAAEADRHLRPPRRGAEQPRSQPAAEEGRCAASSLDPGEEWRQVAPDQLARVVDRPGRAVAGDRGFAVAAAEPAEQVARLGAGPEDPAQDRVERVGLDVAAELGGDRFDRGVGLLGGDAALLDREVGHVADGVGVGEAGDPGVVVDRDEAVGVVGEAVDVAALEPRQADHGVGFDRLARDDRQRARSRSATGWVPVRTSMSRSASSSATCSEARRPKIFSGPSSGVTTVMRVPEIPWSGDFGRRHQGELVGGQRPAVAAGHREDQAAAAGLRAGG